MGERAHHRPLMLFVLAIGLFAGVVATLLFTSIEGAFRDTEVVSKSLKPSSVTYPNDEGMYNASVVEVRTWLLRRDRPYELWIAKGTEPTYGHVVKIDELEDGKRPRIAGADWRPAGVRVRFTTGHEVFVPAAKFLGGR